MSRKQSRKKQAEGSPKQQPTSEQAEATPEGPVLGKDGQPLRWVPDPDGVLRCPVCGKEFKRSQGLGRHFAVKHPGAETQATAEDRERVAAQAAAAAAEDEQLQMTIVEAAEKGDTRAMLVATRRRVALAVQDEATPARDLAALSKRLVEIMREIERIDALAKEEEQEGDGGATPDESFSYDDI